MYDERAVPRVITPTSKEELNAEEGRSHIPSLSPEPLPTPPRPAIPPCHQHSRPVSSQPDEQFTIVLGEKQPDGSRAKLPYCPKCKVLVDHRWGCPTTTLPCIWCSNEACNEDECPNPHVACGGRNGCVVPYSHPNYVSSCPEEADEGHISPTAMDGGACLYEVQVTSD